MLPERQFEQEVGIVLTNIKLRIEDLEKNSHQWRRNIEMMIEENQDDEQNME
jgi:hypothetical protein